MAYRGSNYSFVIDSSFQPYSFQEMLQPYLLYKQEYEKQEAAADELARGANKFKYLSETLPEGSRSRAIYENYANELSRQAEDLSRNGLSINNRQGIVGLKRRYEGEIGLLDRASQKLQKELELRRQLGAKDPSMLYADDNLNIDKYLGDSTPNLYNISGSELYARGAQAGKSASSRLYSAGDEGSTLNGYYRKWVERNGYSKESIDAFRANASAIPELQQAADAILEERGVNENLTGANLERARQSVLNGIIDGAVYQEKVNPVRDAGVMSATEKAADERARKSFDMQKERFDMEKQEWEDQRKLRYTFDEEGNVTGLNPTYVSGDYEVDPNTGKLKKKTVPKPDPEVTAAEKQLKTLRNAKTLKEVDKAGYVPIFATVHPSHGSSKGLSLEEATKQEKYDNIEGWRSGPQGMDVPDLYIDWTGAPLVKGSNSGFMPDIFQWRSGTSSSPNNGDFAYEESDLKGRQVKILSDQEYAKLPPAVIKSIKEELYRQGYDGGIEFQVMEVAGKGGKRSYMTMVKKEDQILQGE